MKRSAFAGSFAGLQAAKSGKPAGVTKAALAPVADAPAGRKVTKKGNPEFDQVTIYIRKDTHNKAWRKWEDAGGKEFSELAETLFKGYAEG